MKYSDMINKDFILIGSVIIFWISMLIWNAKTDYPILIRSDYDAGSRTTKKQKKDLSDDEIKSYKKKALKMRFIFWMFWIIIFVIEYVFLFKAK